MKLIRMLEAGVTVMAVTSAAVAADPWLNAAGRCAAMMDSTARVTCYDQLYATASKAATAPTAPAAPAAPAGVAKAGPAVVAGTAGTAAIGDESLKKPMAERAADSTPTTADARVTALRELRPNVFLISLDNGQVWQQEEWQAMFQPAVGDTVRIKKGALGRFDMSRLANGKSGSWARVTRLK